MFNKRSLITSIKISNRNSITKITTNSQNDNYTNEPDNDGDD
jgi:hypothetical protein